MVPLPRGPRPSLRPLCHYSTLASNPVLPKSVFSKKPVKALDVPPNAYPNPLFKLNKSDVLGLTTRELSHLLRVSNVNVKEANNFCFHILEIIHENILKDTALATKYILLIHSSPLSKTVIDHLYKTYANDPLRTAIISYATDPSSNETRQAITATLEKIFQQGDADVVQLTVGFLRKLAATGKFNLHPVYLTEAQQQALFKHTKRDRIRDLYACLVQTNVKFTHKGWFDSFKFALHQGSALDRLVSRTGLLDPKWHQTQLTGLTSEQREKMLAYFDLDDLSFFARRLIAGGDIVLSKIYLELVVSKFERLGKPDDVELVLGVIMLYLMQFKGARECIKFLRYLVDSDLQVRNSTLLTVLSFLRADHAHEEALYLINYLHQKPLNAYYRRKLVTEIMAVISQHFARNPEIVLGYYALLFGDQSVQDLQDLHVLDLILAPGAGTTSFSRADIHEDLQNSPLMHSDLTNMYALALGSLSQTDRRDILLSRKLYKAYRGKIAEAVAAGDGSSTFHPANLDSGVVTLFIDKLLRAGHQDFDLVKDEERYEVAKNIAADFMALPVKKGSLNVYFFELIITSSVVHHRDLAFGLHMFKLSHSLGKKITFNQIFPFIEHYYSVRDYDKALLWYNILVQNGCKSTSVAGDRLQQMAKERNWPVKGTQYTTAAYKKRKAAAKLGSRLHQDSFERLIGKGTPVPDVEFLDELGKVLAAADRTDRLPELAQ